MQLPTNITLQSLDDTKNVADQFAAIIASGDIIVLNGNLGSGKTTFVKSICTTLNITNTSSPSFAIVNEYEGDFKIYHFDFYRIKKIEELYDIGFEDYLNDSHSIIFIEWGDLWPEILPKAHYEVNLEILSDNKRKLKIHKNN